MMFLAIIATALHVTIAAPHTVKANAKWPVTIRATMAGKPVAATVKMRILLGTIAVGQVDNGKVWHFTGTWREPKGQEITWPASARGMTFNFEAVVRAKGKTVRKIFPVTVR